MHHLNNSIRFSASDLVGHLGHLDCHHLTALDAAVARGSLSKPKIWDPVLQTLVERGLAHEREYVETLKKSGVSVVEIADGGRINERYGASKTPGISRCVFVLCAKMRWARGNIHGGG